MKPILFLLQMPFIDEGVPWICAHCAMLEGALAVNPSWREHIEVRRLPFSKPRHELVAVLGKEQQWLPVLILDEKQIITRPEVIIEYLAQRFGGPTIHP